MEESHVSLMVKAAVHSNGMCSPVFIINTFGPHSHRFPCPVLLLFHFLSLLVLFH